MAMRPYPSRLQLAAGVGIALVESDGITTIHGPNANPDAPAGLFLPGAAAAGQVGKLWVPSGQAFLTMMEANAATPPASADASNHCRLVLAGTAGSQVVALDTAGEGYARWTDDDASLLTAETSPGGSVVAYGVATGVEVLSSITVGALGIRGGGGGYSDWSGVPVSVKVVEFDTGTVVASGSSTSGTTASDWTPFAFDAPVTLDPGHYWVVADGGASAPAWAPILGSSGGSSRGDLWSGGLAAYGDATIYDGRKRALGDSDDWTTWDTIGLGKSAAFAFYGAPAATLLTGQELTVSWESVGAPASAPADVNLRMQWAAAIP